MENLTYEEHGKYFLASGTEITKQDFDAINAATRSTVSGTLTEADILRLHQEQNPASPLFKGSQPAGDELPESNSGEAESTQRYYEPSAGEIEAAATKIPDPAGTTTITTEQATIPPVIEEGKIKEVEPEATEETKPKKGK